MHEGRKAIPLKDFYITIGLDTKINEFPLKYIELMNSTCAYVFNRITFKSARIEILRISVDFSEARKQFIGLE